MKQGHVNIDQLRERAMEALKKAAGQHIDNSGRSPDSLIEELRCTRLNWKCRIRSWSMPRVLRRRP